MEQDKEYFAFISYKSEDVEWAIWVQHELEHYHLPASYNGRTDIRKDLRPVFRDIDELSAGNLPVQIKQALANSQNLIVICSPQAIKSPWVNDEIETFISLGRTDRIFPFIVEGNSPKEFFPQALLNLPKDEERLGGDVSKNGRDAAFVKVVAGMLGVGFDSLWNRYEKEKAEEERKQREQRDNLFKVQSRFIAEKANDLINNGDSYLARRLISEVLPHHLSMPTRPYVAEAELALRRSVQTNNAVLRDFENRTFSAVFSPDDLYILTVSFHDAIKLWSVSSGALLRAYGDSSMNIRNVCFSADGKVFASASWDSSRECRYKPDGNKVRIWNVESGVVEMTLLGHVEGVHTIDFSPDGRLLVSGSLDGAIIIWNLSTGKVYKELKGETAHVWSVKFFPDGKRFVSASVGGKVIIWNVASGSVIRHLTGHTHDVHDVSVSNDGELIASVSADKTVKVWNVSGELLHSFVHEEELDCVAFSPDNKYIACAGLGVNIYIWSLEEEKQKKILKGHNGCIMSLEYSHDGNSLVSTSQDNTVRIWGKRQLGLSWSVKAHEGAVDALSCTFDNKNVVSISSNDDSIMVWDICSGKRAKALNNVFIGHNAYLTEMLNGKTYAMYCYYGPYRPTEFGVMDVLEHKIIDEGEFEFDNDLRISSNGKWIASYSHNHNSVNIWNCKTKRKEYCLSCDGHGTKNVSFCPHSKHIVSVSGYDAFIWFFQEEKCIHVLKGHVDEVAFAIYSPDGAMVLTGSDDKTLRIWNPVTGETLHVLTGHHGPVRSAAFSTDGERIVSGAVDDNINIWNSRTGELLCSYSHKEDYASAVAFSNDGKKVISAHHNGVIQVWDYKPLEEIIQEVSSQFEKHPLSINEKQKYHLLID